jgi:uracil-DNA glycosylase
MSSADFDPGPTETFAAHFANLPDYSPFKEHFWFDWGPVFYRGRLDGSARILCIASDPGATERIAGRTLVGDAGQRVQGFLAKLGLTRSYLCLNAYALALFPSHAQQGEALLRDPVHRGWRNTLYDMAKSASVQAIVAFGAQAQLAVRLWPGKAGTRLFELPHPSSHDAQTLASEWRAAIPQLRSIVTPDPDGNANGPNYGNALAEADYAAIPRRDLPFGVPWFLGDDHWGRVATPPHASSVSRPSPDDRHTLKWIAPKS